MTDGSDGAYRVQICCTLCGNRSMRDMLTGRDVDIVLVLRRSDIDRARAELANARCVLCGEAVALVELGAAEPLPDDRVPIEMTIRTDKRLIVARASGTVRACDVRAARKALRRDPAFSPGFRLLVDLSNATAIDIAPEAIPALAMENVFLPGTRRALVARSNAQYRVAELFAASAARAGQSVTVFRSVNDALDWLVME